MRSLPTQRHDWGNSSSCAELLVLFLEFVPVYLYSVCVPRDVVSVGVSVCPCTRLVLLPVDESTKRRREGFEDHSLVSRFRTDVEILSCPQSRNPSICPSSAPFVLRLPLLPSSMTHDSSLSLFPSDGVTGTEREGETHERQGEKLVRVYVSQEHVTACERKRIKN